MAYFKHFTASIFSLKNKLSWLRPIAHTLKLLSTLMQIGSPVNSFCCRCLD